MNPRLLSVDDRRRSVDRNASFSADISSKSFLFFSGNEWTVT